jgi:hypothetical protein
VREVPYNLGSVIGLGMLRDLRKRVDQEWWRIDVGELEKVTRLDAYSCQNKALDIHRPFKNPMLLAHRV